MSCWVSSRIRAHAQCAAELVAVNCGGGSNVLTSIVSSRGEPADLLVQASTKYEWRSTSEPPLGLTVPPTLLARWRGNARQMQVLARNGPDHGRMPKAVLRVVGNIDDPSAALRRASSNHCSANLSNISRFFGSPVCPAACAQSCANHSYSAVSVITASAVLSRQRRYLVPFRATSVPSERAHVRDLVARAGTGLRSRAVAAGEALKSQGRREEPANFMHFCHAEASEKPIGTSVNHERKSPAPNRTRTKQLNFR
jgi:hypothetical protein